MEVALKYVLAAIMSMIAGIIAMLAMTVATLALLWIASIFSRHLVWG